MEQQIIVNEIIALIAVYPDITAVTKGLQYLFVENHESPMAGVSLQIV